MNTKQIFFSCIILLFAFACDNKDEAFPTYKDINWFEIKDNPNDPLTHLRYTIYKESGISIYYNDTIGRADRGIDLNGNPVIHYEILDPFYTLTPPAEDNGGISNNPTYTIFLGDEEGIMENVTYLKEYVISKLPKTFYPRSILLVDEILTMGMMGPAPITVYQGLMTTLVDAIDPMATEDEKEEWSTTIASTMLTSYFMDKEEIKKFAGFFAISNNSMGENVPVYKQMFAIGMPGFVEDHRILGFLVLHPTEPSMLPYMYTTPDEQEDLRSYVAACYRYTPEEFRKEYEDYPRILSKFKIIQELVSPLLPKK